MSQSERPKFKRRSARYDRDAVLAFDYDGNEPYALENDLADDVVNKWAKHLEETDPKFETVITLQDVEKTNSQSSAN